MSLIEKFIDEDLKIMGCQITIGTPDSKNPFIIKNPKYINEVVDISISDTYRNLINKAEVKIHKGTLFNQRIIKNFVYEDVFDGTENVKRVSKFSPSDDNIRLDMLANGTIVETTLDQSAVNDKTISIGNRIRIELGYNGKLKTMFEGYVTSMSTGSVLSLSCENMAYQLKLKTLSNIKISDKDASINNICSGDINILEGTGFELHPEVARANIMVGGVDLASDYTVADLFNLWAKNKLYASLKYDNRDNKGMPKLTFIAPYSSANRPDGTHPFDYAYPIYFDYHVAKDGLSYDIKDPLFIAVQGSGLKKDGKFFRVVVRRNPLYNASDDNSKKYQFVNVIETVRKSQKKKEFKEGTITGGERFLKSDLRNYNVIPYTSRKIGVTLEELKAECITYLETYEMNGVEGNLTIFGDYGLTSGVHVALIDDRNSDKNGIYIVEEVNTTFSPTGGYRQSLKIPYRVKKTTDDDNKVYKR